MEKDRATALVALLQIYTDEGTATEYLTLDYDTICDNVQLRQQQTAIGSHHDTGTSTSPITDGSSLGSSVSSETRVTHGGTRHAWTDIDSGAPPGTLVPVAEEGEDDGGDQRNGNRRGGASGLGGTLQRTGDADDSDDDYADIPPLKPEGFARNLVPFSPAAPSLTRTGYSSLPGDATDTIIDIEGYDDDGDDAENKGAFLLACAHLGSSHPRVPPVYSSVVPTMFGELTAFCRLRWVCVCVNRLPFRLRCHIRQVKRDVRLAFTVVFGPAGQH